MNKNLDEILESEGADDHIYSEDNEDITATEGSTKVAAIIDRCTDKYLNTIVSQNNIPRESKSRSKMMYDVTKPIIIRHTYQRISTRKRK